MDPFQIKYMITPEDYKKVSFYLTFARKKDYPWLMAGVFVLAVIVIIWRLVSPGDIDTVMFGASIVYICIALLVPIVAVMTAKKFISTDQIIIGRERSMLFDENGIRETGEGSSDSIQWGQFHKVMEMKNYFLYFTNNLQSLIVPKRYIDVQNQKEMRSFLKRKLGKKYDSRI